ncbi:hypothetical protein [Aurantibacter sp.]|uniref:hypothetical protein n=1 Tax=Aurantibacter sp. TaxID=2807103 RepID=UPI0032659FAB
MRQKLYLLLPLVLICNLTLVAQKKLPNKKIFVRVYDATKRKIAKGKLHYIYKDSIVLLRNEKLTAIPVNRMSIIKTKRSFGNSIGMGAVVGTSFGLVFGYLAGSEGDFIFTRAESSLISGFLGLIAGSSIGGILGVIKHPKSFQIDHKPEKLLEFKKSISKRYK